MLFARIFEIGKSAKLTYDPEIDEIFQYIYPETHREETAIKVEILKSKSSTGISMKVGGIRYVHSARMLSEALDSVDQFEAEWAKQISQSTRNMMKSAASSKIRSTFKDLGYESTFYKPDDLPKTVKPTQKKVLTSIEIVAPTLAMPMSGYADRLHMGNNYYFICCPGQMWLEKIEEVSAEDLVLFSLTLTNLRKKFRILSTAKLSF